MPQRRRRERRGFAKKIKKFCPTLNINLKSCLESFQNPTSEVGDFQSFLSISRWHGRTCNHETASKGEAKFPSPPHSPPVPLRRFLFKTNRRLRGPIPPPLALVGHISQTYAFAALQRFLLPSFGDPPDAPLRLGKSLGGRDYTYTTRGTYRTYTCATSIYETMFFSQNHRTFSSKKSTKIVGFVPILFLWHITLLIKKISPRRYFSLNFPSSSSSPLPNKKPTTSSLAPYHQG